VSGELLAEDPLCSHEPGTYPQARELLRPALSYGESTIAALAWEPAAEERMKRVPAFVRGMVVRAVEDYCRRNAIPTVTLAALEEIRSRMPTPRVFGPRGNDA
jgi:hypothetical protein